MLSKVITLTKMNELKLCYFLIRYAQPKINHLAAIVPYAITGQEYYDNTVVYLYKRVSFCCALACHSYEHLYL